MIHSYEQFDFNEWFILIFLVATSLIAYFLPRRFPVTLSVLVVLFAAAVSRLTDHLLAGPAHSDLYDIMDRNKIEYFDILSYLFYGPPAYFLAYFFDKLKVRGLRITLYIVVCSVAACGIEWIASKFDVFFYKEWNLFYSLMIYLLVQSLALWFFHFIKSKHAGMQTG